VTSLCHSTSQNLPAHCSPDLSSMLAPVGGQKQWRLYRGFLRLLATMQKR